MAANDLEDRLGEIFERIRQDRPEDFFQQIGLSEIEEANELKSRLDRLQSSFNGFGPDYDKSVWVELLDDMKSFENLVSTFQILHFFYGYMARSALNAQEVIDCIIYANAGLELSKKEGDAEGISSCMTILCDLAVTVGCFTQAAEIFKASHPHETEYSKRIYRILVDKSSKEESKDEYGFFTDERPDSFKFVVGENTQEESTIRLLMSRMGVSRSTAKEYLKYYQKADKQSI
jgi:hypothetical protein